MMAGSEANEEDEFIHRVQSLEPHLYTSQLSLCLRNLSKIDARKLVTLNDRKDQLAIDSPLPSCFKKSDLSSGFSYTLHYSKSKPVIYTSELQPSQNPKWEVFDLKRLIPVNLTSLKGIILKIWLTTNTGEVKLILRWGIKFSGLVPIGDEIPSNICNLPDNAIFFKFSDVFYTSPDCVESYFHNCDKVYTPSIRKDISLLLSETKRSYSVKALSRLHMSKRDLRNLEEKRAYLYDCLIHRKLNENDPLHVLKSEVESSQLTVTLLREELESKIDQLRVQKSVVDALVNENQETAMQLMNDYYLLNKKLAAMRTLQESVNTNTATLYETNVYLTERRRQLIYQLPLIFPITQDDKGEYYIAGIHLPDAENYDQADDTDLSVALGYVAHFLVILAQLMNVPLTFPVAPFGSMATIRDNTSKLLRENERIFPLYTRGKDRARRPFEYGVFLLNKNIAQLRWYCGLMTPDLRPTLANLASLVTHITLTSDSAMSSNLLPDALVFPPSCGTSVKLDVKTPTLLDECAYLHLPLNPAALSSDACQVHSKSSCAELFPLLNTKEMLGEEQNKNSETIVEQEAYNAMTTSISTGLSLSLDQGLDELGLDSYLNSCQKHPKLEGNHVTAVYISGSDPNLLVQEPVNDSLEVNPFKQDVSSKLLISWPPNGDPYGNASEVGSSDRLDEVGTEATEEVLKKAYEEHKEREVGKAVENPSSFINSPTCESLSTLECSHSEQKCNSVDVKAMDNTKCAEQERSSDFILNDVALRTAVLASQNCSFKISFSRQHKE